MIIGIKDSNRVCATSGCEISTLPVISNDTESSSSTFTCSPCSFGNNIPSLQSPSEDSTNELVDEFFSWDDQILKRFLSSDNEEESVTEEYVPKENKEIPENLPFDVDEFLSSMEKELTLPPTENKDALRIPENFPSYDLKQECTQENLNIFNYPNNNFSPLSPPNGSTIDPEEPSVPFEETEELTVPPKISVVKNKDTKSGGSTDPNDPWTKNKYRSISFILSGLSATLYVSPNNYTKGNGKKKSIEKGLNDLEFESYLLDENGNLIVPCSQCKKPLVEICADSQRLQADEGRELAIKVRLNCLPCYHETSMFSMVFQIKNSDDELIAQTYFPISKVIASRSTQRRQ